MTLIKNKSLLVLALFVFVSLPNVVQGQAAKTRFHKSDKPVANHYIVVFAAQMKSANRDKLAADIAAQYSGQVTFVFHHALNGIAISMPAGAADALSRDPRVEFVEEDGIASANTTQPNPPSYGLDRIDQRFLPLDGLYNYNNNGNAVNAYVVDTGIRMSHQDFGGRAHFGADEIGDGMNGSDCNGHGTHVSGTLGGNAFGVAKGVNLFSVRVFDCGGNGTVSTVIAGVDWITGHRNLPAVANMSLGGPASDALDSAVRSMISSGVVTVVAAGNENLDASGFSPARVAEALTVGASDGGDNRASFSNFGAILDVFAPGVNITSDYFTSDTATAVMSGTSMATPHVAGVAALFLQSNPFANPAAVANAIIGNATANVVVNPGPGSPNRLLYSLFMSGSPYARFALQTGTPISQPDAAANFVFAVADFNFDGIPDIFCLKRTNTGTGTLEVHVLNGATNYQSFLLQTGTALDAGDAAANFTFAVADFNGDGVPDVFALKTTNTGTGTLEVHVLDGAANYQSFLLHAGTVLDAGDAAANFSFTVGDFNGDGIPDVFGFKRTNTGTGTLEVHVLDGATTYQSFLLQTGTPIIAADAAANFTFALGDYNQDGVPDIFGFKQSSTGTGTLEVHVLSGATSYQSFLQQTGTPIQQADAAANFLFATADFNGDGVPDVFGFKRTNTGTGTLEVHILSSN